MSQADDGQNASQSICGSGAVVASVAAAPAAPTLKDASPTLGGTQTSVVKAGTEDGKEIEIKDAVLKPHRRIVELKALRALAAIHRLLFHLSHVCAVKYEFSSPLGFDWCCGAYGKEMFLFSANL